MAALLFRIPKHGRRGNFAAGLRAPFAGAAGSDPFDVPSIPGAHGYSVQIASPVRAVEQIVVFRCRPVRVDDRAGIVGLDLQSGCPHPVPGHRRELSTVRGPPPRGLRRLGRCGPAARRGR